ncbi:unnamed protein product [Callosobruchus maculatus]|uniref:Serpin domain-containing protein n=1 Tax=Callosobruchus maculatus TaxID=64391 RepID=A0A653DAS1_CALMS|nr:unnamed protein product [Callosobruchus maculatus]
MALSPYGALSVLVILGEGLQGEAVREVQDAAKLPNDISVIRVGLRDIHKHLKSYFFPKEGFLAGLTLNHENITFRPEYEDVLKFYGYDISAFNSALFPDSDKAGVPQESTTPDDTNTSTGDMLNSDGSETTTSIATTTKAAATTTTVTEAPSAATAPAVQSEAATVTTETLKVVPDTTTVTTTTTEKLTTTTVTEAPTTTTTEKRTTTTAATTPTTTMATTTLPTTKQPTTTTQATTTTQPTTTTTTQSTTIVPTEETTTSPSTEGEDETEIVTEIVTEFFTEIIEEEPTEVSELVTDDTEITEQPNEADSLTPSIAITESTTTMESETTAVDQPTTQSTAALDTSIETSTLSMEQIATEESVGFAGELRDARSKQDIQVAPRRNTTRPKPRKPRSVMDYLLAKYYDDFYVPEDIKNGASRTFLPSDKTFAPVPAANVPPNFLVYGKFRDYHVNFMKYDAVLPYYFVPYLNSIAITLPLDSTNYYLLLLLPMNERGIDKLIHDLSLSGGLRSIVRSLRHRRVVATIPSFMLKGYVNLTPTLQTLGVRRIFEPRQADFSPMTNDRDDIYITNIEQAITVNIRNYMDPNILENHAELRQTTPLDFTADHPFLYFVMDSELHVSLMAGKVVNPTNSRIR